MNDLPTTIGPYRILDLLGRGGMGSVYRGEHLETGARVAVKVVRADRAGNLAAIRRELHALSRIRHPSIVRVVDNGVEGDTPWYAMELLEGRTLRGRSTTGQQHLQGTRVADPAATLEIPPTLAPDGTPAGAAPVPERPPSGPARLSEVLTLFRRLCAPLAFLHGEGFVHRDLKPDNVLILADGRPVLVDFGIAAYAAGTVGREALVRAWESSGTAAYMAPEQALGEFVDARADLYAFGCMLYEQLTGSPPFQRPSSALTALAHVESAPEPPSARAEGIPPELDALVLRLLAKRPADRLGHADDVAAALARLGAGGGPGDEGPRPRAYLYRAGFAGRERLLDAFQGPVSGLARRRGGVVLVGGESGVGKTRLALEVAREAEMQGARVLMGESRPVASADAAGAPLSLLAGPIDALADTCRERGRPMSEAVFGPRGPVLAAYRPAVGRLPGQRAHTPPADLPPEAARRRLFAALADTFAAAAAETPLVLLLDDLQWADELSLGFVRALARSPLLDRTPLLLIGTYRDDEVSEALAPVLAAQGATRLHVGRLGHEAVAAIVGDMLALSPPPAALSRFLARESEGNPFFVAEYLRTAVDEKLLWRDEHGNWQIAGEGSRPAAEADYERLPLPKSLRAIVDRRLSDLPPEASRAAAAAAVLGRDVDLALLDRLTGLGELALMEAARELLRRQVFDEDESGRLRFAHDKVREGAYGSLDAAERARLHRAAAGAIEAGGDGEDPAALALHWERAGEPARARGYMLAAARLARDRYAHRDAERHYRAFLAVAGPPSADTVAAHGELGADVLQLQGRIDDARDELAKALEGARALGDVAAEARSLRRMGTLAWQTGRIGEARGELERALEKAREAGDRAEEGLVLGNLGIIADDHGDTGRARELYERAIALARETGNRTGEGKTVGNLAITYEYEGDYARARALYEEALAIHREAGNRRSEGMTLGNLASLEALTGRAEAARALCEQALAIHHELGNRREEGVTLNNLASVLGALGQVEEARDAFARALRISREVGNRRFEGITLVYWAALERRLGAPGRAGEMLAEAAGVFEEVGELLYAGVCRCELGHVALSRGEPAFGELEGARAVAASISARPESELGQAIARLERAASRPASELRFGECPEDVPRGIVAGSQ